MTEYGRAFVCDTQLTEEDVTPMLLDNFARECISTPALAGHTPQIRSSGVWPVYEDYIEDEYGDIEEGFCDHDCDDPDCEDLDDQEDSEP